MAPMLALLLGFVFFACSGAEVAEEESVLVLNDKNFDEAVRASPFILVEFYAPWCGHCKQFAPEYASAAKQLKATSPPVPLAKVDATTETKLAEQYGVRGYPTIKLFIDGKDQEYTGGRTEQSIVTWVLKKTGPSAVELKDAAEAEQFEKDNRLAVIGLFEEGQSADAFTAAAKQLEDVMFAFSHSKEVLARYQDVTAAPAIKMFFPFDEKSATFAGDCQSAAEIETFVRAYRQPAVSLFDGESAPEIFGDGRTILFLFRDKDDKGEAAEKEIRDAAAGMNRRLLVSVAGSSEPMDQRLMDYVGVEPEELPTVRLVANPTAGMIKYKLDGDINAATIGSFVRDYESGKIRPHLKSEPVPDSQPGPVFTLVGSTFDSIVKNPSKDVLVEFYAPWCGHCKKLDPIFREIAKKLEGVRSIVIAKIDATANDVDGVSVEGFPTIKLWRADKKDDPIDYDGDRDADSFITWLEEKAALPFNRDELKTEL